MISLAQHGSYQVFKFEHPNPELSSNERFAELSWTVDHAATIHGFVGCVITCLYTVYADLNWIGILTVCFISLSQVRRFAFQSTLRHFRLECSLGFLFTSPSVSQCMPQLALMLQH